MNTEVRLPRLILPLTRATYLTFTLLVAAEDLVKRGPLTLSAPGLPDVHVRLYGISRSGFEVLLYTRDPLGARRCGTREPQALLFFDDRQRRVYPLRLWLAGRHLEVPPPRADDPVGTMTACQEEATDLLETFLVHLAVSRYEVADDAP